MTKFLEEHPGGEEVLMEVSGKDATKEFEEIGHSKAAKKLLLKYQVGYLQGYPIEDDNDDDEVIMDDSTSSFKEESKTKEMEAFVINNNDQYTSKIATFLEFFLPLAASLSYLGYRYFAGELSK